MHKYYDWQLVRTLPLEALDGLLSYAEKEEKRREKDELSKQLLPLWLVRFAPQIIKGEKPPIGFEEFVNMTATDASTLKAAPQKEDEPLRTAAEIEAEFMPYIEADRRRGG